MNRYAMIITIIVALATLSGCTAIILKKPIEKENKVWKVVISRAYDNVPYQTGNTIFQPEHGHRLIRFTATITNKTNRARVFNLENVILAYNNKASRPSFVDGAKGINLQFKHNPKLAPRETISRILYYVFPNELTPNKIHIKGMGTFKLPFYKKKI